VRNGHKFKFSHFLVPSFQIQFKWRWIEGRKEAFAFVVPFNLLKWAKSLFPLTKEEMDNLDIEAIK
jgi:hypothetical protein